MREGLKHRPTIENPEDCKGCLYYQSKCIKPERKEFLSQHCWKKASDYVRCTLCNDAFPKNDTAKQVDHMYVRHNAKIDKDDLHAKFMAYTYIE